jgi:predicted dehydrogenase
MSLGLGALAVMPQTFGIAPGSEKKVGIALVGLGNYATHILGPSLKETKNCYLSGIVTGTPSKATQWAAEFSIPEKNIYNYNTFDEIASNDDIDVIYIVLPNFMHKEYTIRAAQAGKHVICEKPMGMNAQECEEMIAACEKAGVKLTVGYRLHYEPHHQEMIRLSREETYGPINFIEGSLAYFIPDATSWRLDKDMGGGGAIMDLGVYPLQATRYITGEEPVAVTAQGYIRNHVRYKGIYESMFWQLQFPSGIIANCTTSYSSFQDRLYVSAKNGFYELNPSFGGRGSAGRTSDGPMVLPKANQTASHMDDFSLSILENKPIKVTGYNAFQDMRIIDAIKKAAFTGKRILL